ncbi:hypothetical protein B0H12DRAFT_1065789 [Mycena haematopus]|nr:hypothetical protein B0H12DRAFT_1065789 [Mycena haematopus]
MTFVSVDVGKAKGSSLSLKRERSEARAVTGSDSEMKVRRLYESEEGRWSTVGAAVWNVSLGESGNFVGGITCVTWRFLCGWGELAARSNGDGTEVRQGTPVGVGGRGWVQYGTEANWDQRQEIPVVVDGKHYPENIQKKVETHRLSKRKTGLNQQALSSSAVKSTSGSGVDSTLNGAKYGVTSTTLVSKINIEITGPVNKSKTELPQQLGGGWINIVIGSRQHQRKERSACEREND